jgi:hypothetical protein
MLDFWYHEVASLGFASVNFGSLDYASIGNVMIPDFFTFILYIFDN